MTTPADAPMVDPTAKIAELRVLLAEANADIYRRERAENDVRGRLNMALSIIEDLRAGRPVADWRLAFARKTAPSELAGGGGQ